MSVTLKDVGSGFKRTAINQNFTDIESEINNNLLNKDGSTALEADLDFNSNRAINLADGVLGTDGVNVNQLNAIVSGAGGLSSIAQARETQLGSQAVANVFTLSGITYAVGTNTLSVYRNGQRLEKTVDYTEATASSVTLTFTPNGTDRFVFITNDLSTSEVTTTAAIIHTEDGTDYNLATYLSTREANTVAELKTLSPEVGERIVTKGYYTAGDGGHATHIVAAPQAVDGYGDHTLANGNVAKLQSVGVADARQYGAIEGAGNDNVSSIQALFDSGNVPLIGASQDDVYEVSDTVTLPAGTDLDCRGTLVYTGIQDRPCLIIGASGEQVIRKVLNIRVQSKVLSDWSNESYVGVLMHNCNTCEVNIARAENFTIGAQAVATDAGWAYNTVSLGYFISNKIGLDLVNAGTGGFVNENLWIKGRFAVNSTDNTTLDRFGIRARSANSLLMNANTFISPSFEMQDSFTTGLAIAIDVEDFIQNKILECRTESNSDPSFLIGANCASNEITSTFGTVTINDSGATPSTIVESSRDKIRTNSLDTWNSGPVGYNATAYNATDIMVPGCEVVSSGGAIGLFLGGFSIADREFLETTAARGVSIAIDTATLKQFVVRRNALEGFGGRVVIKAFDAAGSVLTGTTPSYITGQRGVTLSAIGTYGGAYQTGSDSNGDTYFQCHEDVKSVDVMVVSGSAHLKLRSFSVSAVNNSMGTAIRAFRRTDLVFDENRYADQSPQTSGIGTYSKATRVFHNNPAIAQPQGWVCAVSGTPGTWLVMPNL